MSLADKLIEIQRNVPKVYEAGYAAGESVGYGTGYTEGEEAGKQSANAALWDAILMNGNRTDYQRAFAYTSYTPETFLPNHDIRPVGSASDMFHNASPATSNEDDYIDMVELEERMGIVFDFSKTTNLYAGFASSPFKRINRVDLSGINNSYYTHYMFYPLYEMQMLKRIEHLIFPGTLTAVEATMFTRCINLEHIGFEGTIAASGLTLADCRILDQDTFIKLFAALSTTTSGLSVTLSRTAVDTAFETSAGAADGSTSVEWADLVNTRSNWTINLV